MQNNLPTQTLSGVTLNPADYRKRLGVEFKHAENVLVEEYQGKIDHLVSVMKMRVFEYNLMHSIFAANTVSDGKPNLPAIQEVEKVLAGQTLETCFYSITIREWKHDIGQDNFIVMLSDIMNYFFKQFEVKEKVSDVQIMQLSIKLLAAHPVLKLKELIYILNKALQGHYGQTYQRIGIDSILNWISLYYEESAVHLESIRVNGKQEESRGANPWDIEEKRLKKYEDEQRQKQRIVQKVWGEEKKAQEDTARKEQIEAYKNSLTKNEKE